MTEELPSEPEPQERAQSAFISRKSRAARAPLARVIGFLSATPGRARLVTASAIYAATTLIYFLFASRALLDTHTDYNHFVHLADAWLDGRLHLEGGPPDYARNNDFAKYDGKWYVAFPPFPAFLLLPVVAFAGEVELVRDGQFFLWIAGLGPSVLFLALERLREQGSSTRTPFGNVVLTLCFALGTVYFFTAEQGTVWFAAHVVGVVLGALYLLFAIGARNPVWAGVAIGLGMLTRAPLLFAVPLFALEALRVCSLPADTATRVEARGLGWVTRGRALVRGLDVPRLLRLYALFAAPIVVCLALNFWHNAARFDSPFDPGYQHLTVAWAARMKKWGLFHYHYLSRNLAVATAMLPWLGNDAVPFRINVHGLALWFTTPLYFWLLWPRRTGALHWALWLTVACVGLPALFYQNSGWAQFGYRFSNDYAVFLFALLAIGGLPMRTLFAAAAIWGVVVNGFGAFTFGKKQYQDFYYWDASQQRLFEKD